MNTHNKFSNRLKELRLEKNLSYLSLSKQTGISDAQLCRLENGKSNITSENLITLAKYFNVSTDYLLGLED